MQGKIKLTTNTFILLSDILVYQIIYDAQNTETYDFVFLYNGHVLIIV